MKSTKQKSKVPASWGAKLRRMAQVLGMREWPTLNLPQLTRPHHTQMQRSNTRNSRVLQRCHHHPFLPSFSTRCYLLSFFTQMTSSNQRNANDLPTGWEWVDPQVLATKSVITRLDATSLTPANFLQPNIDPKTVSFSPCTDSERVCLSRVDKAGEEFFYVYYMLFTTLGLRLPFSDFQLQFLNSINAAPTQLHPSAWLLVISFELLCQSCALVPTVSTFFFFFELVHVEERMSWVHIRARPGSRKILTCNNWSCNFKNCFLRVEGREGSVPFFMDENRKPKFPLHWSKSVPSPNTYLSSLSDCERTLVLKLRLLKTPIDCSRLIQCNDVLLGRLLFIPCSYVSPDSEREEDQVVEVPASAVMKMKRKQQIVDVEKMEHLRGFEGEGSIASLWDSRFDFDRHVRRHYQDKLRCTGHVDVGCFVKANASRIAAGVEFLVEEVEMNCEAVSQLTAELEMERSARIKAEGQLEEEKVGREKAERELARVRKESEYTEGRLVREWKKSVTVSFQNAMDQVRLGFPHLNFDSIALDPFKVVEGQQLVDPPSAAP